MTASDEEGNWKTPNKDNNAWTDLEHETEAWNNSKLILPIVKYLSLVFTDKAKEISNTLVAQACPIDLDQVLVNVVDAVSNATPRSLKAIDPVHHQTTT